MSDELQFDRVEPSPDAAAGSAGIACSNCGTQIVSAYFNVGTDPFCARCKAAIQAHIVPDTSMGAFWRALALGVVASIAGAGVYYGVIAVTNLEIGIVAILIGYMVGWAVKKGASGRGGRRFQVMAVALTYFSVGLAYFPMALAGGEKMDDDAAVHTDSAKVVTSAPTPTANTATVAHPAKARTGFLLAIAMLVGLTFALPVLVIINSMPSGLISAIIILVGMRQAWHMTAVPRIQITGPFRVGTSVPGGSI